jgi:hypothetical protein
MPLHDADCEAAHTRRTPSRSRFATTSARATRAATASLACACAMLIACGDDGTDGLSMCPDRKILLGADDTLHCAPRAGSAAPVKPATAAAKSTASSTRADTAANAGARSGAADSGGSSNGAPGSGGNAQGSGGSSTPAASGNSGTGDSEAPAIPSGPWSCLQVSDACSCAPNSDLGDSCRKPHPTCCNLVVLNGKAVSCVCVPSTSDQCAGMKADPVNYPSVTKCPP